MLESGAGPTVQEALKNPALFSMIIQLSMLSATHTDVSLANAIVTAVENILRDAEAGSESAPEYVSLVGTIRACQQQTAFFEWSSLYNAVEHKIQRTLATAKERSVGDPKMKRISDRWRTETKCIQNKSLPFPVFQSLMMWLQSLQSFPEHRLLHVRCDKGITTVVVWCHHLLGLNVTVRLDGVDTWFGQGMSNVLIEESTSKEAGASLLDAANQNEPLFSLSRTEEDPLLDFEARAEAFGYGMVILKQSINNANDMRFCAYGIIGQGLQLLREWSGFNEPPSRSHQGLNEQRILQAGRFLFPLDHLDQELIETMSFKPAREVEKDQEVSLAPWKWTELVATLVTFARVQDLKNCMSMSLSIKGYDCDFGFLGHPGRRGGLEALPNLLNCFNRLSHLLLGNCYTEDSVGSAVLISGWGWSIFFDTFDAIDPANVSQDTMRVMPGVPSRRGLRKARILDGPMDLGNSPNGIMAWDGVVPTPERPGISTIKRGPVLVCYHGTDGFSVLQSFEWISPHDTKYRYKLGFRQMQEICSKLKILRSCNCEDMITDEIDWIDCHTEALNKRLDRGICYYPTERIARSLQTRDFEKVETKDLESQTEDTLMYCHSIIRSGSSSSHPSASSDERVVIKRRVIVRPFRREDPGVIGIEIQPVSTAVCCWYFYVANNPAARWLQLAYLQLAYLQLADFLGPDLLGPDFLGADLLGFDLLEADLTSYGGRRRKQKFYFLRGDDYCLACARKFAPAWPDAVIQTSTAEIDKIMVVLL